MLLYCPENKDRRPLSPLLQINRHGAGGTKVLTVHPALMH